MSYNHPYPTDQPGLIPTSPAPAPAPALAHEVKPNADPNYVQSQYSYGQSGGYPYTQADSSTVGPSRGERRVCGLPAATFWLLLALIIVIVAAAVGGGVGGSLAVNNAKTQCLTSASAILAAAASATSIITTTTTSPPTFSSSPSSTAAPTSSSSSAIPLFTSGTTAWGPLATALPYTGCPDKNNTVYTTTVRGSKFQIICGLDIPYTGTSDLLNAITPTFDLCIELCASWNDLGHSNGNASVQCKGVAFIPSHVNGDGAGQPADCVLKNYADNFNANPSYLVDSAVLL